MSSDDWEEMAKRWRDMAQQQAALVQKEWLDSQSRLATALGGGKHPDPAASAEALTELWRSWISLGSLWPSPPGDHTGPPPGVGMLGALPGSVSLSLASGSQVTEMLRRMAEGPRLADVGGPERLMAKVMELWISVQDSAHNYETVVARAFAEANTRFAAMLSERYRTTKDAPDANEALRRWLDIANQVLLETHRSAKFLEAQRRLLRDGMDFMLIQREFVEGLVEPAGLPTRSELDEVHRSIHGLKRRVKALEKGAVAQACAAAASVPDDDGGPSNATPTRARGEQG